MIYAIVGPTGVGKTKLSIELAKKIGNAEIINCDSMQVYKELNIGVAKVTEEEKENIPHHLFDVVSINVSFNCFDYQTLGRKLINNLLNKNKNIIIVGGTGLYLKALLYDYNFKDKNSSNKKLYDFKLIGLTKDRQSLYKSIDNRVDKMIEMGLIDEVKSLISNTTSRALNTAIGYKQLINYINNSISLEDTVNDIKQASRRYAKRQYTFFNNQFNNITWYDVEKESISEIINKIIK